MSQGDAVSADHAGFVKRHPTIVRRGCLAVGAMVFLVLPAAGLGSAIWLMFTPTAPEVSSATAYKNAPACSSLMQTEQGCIQNERAEMVSFSRSIGRCGSHTDQLTLKLADGLHTAEIAFDCLAANRFYELPDGRVNVREYRGLVTTIYDVDGKAYETTDSPTGGASWRRGIAAGILVVTIPWLIVMAFLVIGVRFGLPRAKRRN